MRERTAFGDQNQSVSKEGSVTAQSPSKKWFGVRESIQLRRVITYCSELSIVETLLNQTKCRADDFYGKTAVTKYGVKGAFKAADHALPGAAIVPRGSETISAPQEDRPSSVRMT